MTNLPATLYALQTHELAIDDYRRRLKQIEQELANDAALVAAREDYTQQETSLHQAEARVTDLELEIEGLKEKIKTVDELLYSGRIKNPKELQDRQEELSSLKRRLDILEERLIEARADAEKQQEVFATAENNLARVQAEQAEEQQELMAEQKELNKKIKQNLRKRKEILPMIPENIYKQYKALRKQKRGVAVAKLDKDGACDACHITQNNNVVREVQASDNPVYCRSCGRILTDTN